jgi:CubicO group peptidase (beta-lactamase class C family)
MSGHDAARQVVGEAIRTRVFPAAALEVGGSAGPIWRDALGTLTFEPGASASTLDTPFDLASLTKPMATTTVVMELVRIGGLRLDEPLSTFFPDWRGVDRAAVTVRDLLEHASGLPARLVDLPPETRREFEHEIGTIALEYAPRSASTYSDLGFILLGFLVADRGGAPLAEQFAQITVRLSASAPPDFTGATARPDRRAEREGRKPHPGGLTFTLPLEQRALAAPTLPMDEDPRRGRLLAGEVHDNYAAALGGVAGHAGLFGTAPEVGAFARAILRAARGASDSAPPFTPALLSAFTSRTAVPNSSRALGWDTMLATSSCGGRMSRAAFGHVGFTGTSLWIDPERDRYFVLLTNRACGGGTLDQMRTVRRAFHDALGDL